MDDLLKEAIADAKAVRETALENAKMALEEAFTPKLQSMLSQKIQNEIEDEDDEKNEVSKVYDIAKKEKEDDDMDEMKMDDMKMDDDEDMEEMKMDDDEDMEEMKMDDDEEMDESKIIEIDGVKYAPVVAEEEDEDDMDEIAKKEKEDDMDEDLDLESVIKELESEIDEIAKKEDEDEKMDENDVSSDIGKGDNKVNKKANDTTGVGADGKAKLKEGEDKEDDMDEDIDLDEVLKALSEEEEEDEKKDEVKELKSDLEEHRSVIETLRGKLNEVNLLNAKLLFTNKLFRKYGLNNEQKMKVVEQFDRANNLREVKLVYSTLGESFINARNNINESKGAASKPVASTKSEKKVISESTDLRDRFKKLANLI